MLAFLDRYLKPWHVISLNLAALAWFLGMTTASRMALPGQAIFRCPIGFCAGGYSPEDLYSLFDEIGEEGRAFISDTILRADLVLPSLLLLTLVIDIVWLSRPAPGAPGLNIALQPAARLALLSVPVLYCVADYLENAALGEILRRYPEITDAMTERASLLTAAKSQLVAASMGIVAALAVAAWGVSVRSQPPARD